MGSHLSKYLKVSMKQQPHNFSDSDKYNLVAGQRGSQNRFFCYSTAE